ncbi:cytochrome-c peroxidase [Tunturiibacter gelidiferens]|uniref:cytochrome-c peroxidase n=1 Tax=Tunturiibacter gelidiferens TaxID=3069689 RepID=UPI003D9BFA73
MRQTRLIALVAACMTIAVAMSISRHIVHGQTVYNPYPTGILPSNIDPEIARVLREVNSIEAEAIRQWHALPPPVVTGNPPTLQNTGVASIEILGKLMNFDRTISPNENEACSSCHMPYAGYSGPIPSVNLTMIAYPGSVHFRAGKRTAQRYTYSAYFPPLQYDAVQGLFFGGNFWDSRATGYLLRSPDAEQSQGPPVDPNEMGNPDTACVTYKLSLAPYRPLFELVWGAGSFDITWPANIAQICATPNGASVFNGNPTPVALSSADRTRSNNDYDHWAQSLNAFEHSESVSPFTSKFDAYLKGTYKLTAKEAAGYALFRGKGNCNSCHLDGRSTAPAPTNTGAEDTGVAANVTPVFTCFGSANEGLPKNPRDSFYYETTPDSFGFTPNPGGFTYTDFGLGTFLRSGFGSAPNPNSSWRQFASTVDGQMQVMTARNVGLTPPSCPTTEAPGPYFQKEFFHNGYIKSLKQLVHFYNTRDLYRNAVSSGNCPAGTTEKVNCWPEPEVPQNIDMTTGNLGLTGAEEDQIVAFLQTLSDGFTTPYPDVNTYTGACMTGGTAATQGNSTIIPADLLRQFQQMQR